VLMHLANRQDSQHKQQNAQWIEDQREAA